ncbi:MAG: OmpH family outer membrane protein [Planctomycetota bacterium]
MLEKKMPNWIVFVLLFLAFAWFQKPVETNPEKFQIGVVNINKAFEGYSLTAEFEKQLNTDFEEKMKIFQQMNSDIQKLQDELELLEKGSQKWKEKNKELQQKIFNASFFEKWEKQQFNDKLRDLTVKIYNDISEAVDQYAKDKGFTLILKIDDVDIKSENRTELKLKINDRKVLFYKSSYDLTADIIKLLNK